MVDVNANQLKHTLEILKREARLSGGDRRRFKFLNVFGYGFLSFAIVMGCFWAALPPFLGVPLFPLADWDLRSCCFWDFFFAHTVGVFVWTSILCSVPHMFTFYRMLRLNLPTVRAVWRQERMVSKLGLGEALAEPWRDERAKHPVRNFLTLCTGPFLFGWAVFFAVLRWRVEMWKGELFDQWYHSPWLVYLFCIYTVLVGLMYIGMHWLRRGEERLRAVTRLQRSLEESKRGAAPGEDSISIPSDVYDQIARIERAQISRDRATSILKFKRESDVSYVVQKSRLLRNVQSSLDAATRLRVQDEIDRLTEGPRGSDAAKDDNQEMLWRNVPQTSCEIGFSVDEAARRIHVLALKTADKEPSVAKERV